MKRISTPRRSDSAGYALVFVLVFSTLTLMAVASLLSWGSSNYTQVQRNNTYFSTVAAAEAATEKVISAIASDYQNEGEALVYSRQGTYRDLVPTTAEDPAWQNFEFSDGAGNENKVFLQQHQAQNEFRVLSSQYRGLRGYSTAYRIIANARDLTSPYGITAGLRQDIEVATIPIFQFAIFYNLDLEINPGAVMTIGGPVHCNANIYIQPQNVLTFESDVTAVGPITHDKKPGDPVSRSGGSIVYRAEHDALVSTLSMPIGTNNSPSAVREVVEIPPTGESVDSAMGKVRFYNKAELIILVKNSSVEIKSSLLTTNILVRQCTNFLNTNVTFYNKREDKTIKATQIDIAKLKKWSETNAVLRSVLPFPNVRLVYVADQRTQTSTTESGIRLVNGQFLPANGLTLITPNPLYIQGHYNVPDAALGTTNTSNTKPAALIADAITILSTDWSDSNATKSLSNRPADDTTVNAAFLAGIVPTVSGSYSGGVENFPRFLENWSGKTFTYNGSMVVMFPSKYATAEWGGTGDSYGIYNAPNRKWAFDQNFRTASKLPPETPSLRAMVRGTWTTMAPGTTTVSSL